MRVYQATALFAGLALGLPNNAGQTATKPFLEKSGKFCGDRRSNGPKDYSEECQGTMIYCTEQLYWNFKEKYADPAACLRARGVNSLDEKAGPGIDRHVQDYDASREANQHLGDADSAYTRWVLLQKLETTLSTDFKDRSQENEQVQAAVREIKDLEQKSKEEIKKAKELYRKAYKPHFAEDISEAIDESVKDVEKQWADFKIDNIAAIPAEGELKTLLKKANDLAIRFKVVETLRLHGLVNDEHSILAAFREAYDDAKNKALSMPNDQDLIRQMDDAKAKTNKAWSTVNIYQSRMTKFWDWFGKHEAKW